MIFNLAIPSHVSCSQGILDVTGLQVKKKKWPLPSFDMTLNIGACMNAGIWIWPSTATTYSPNPKLQRTSDWRLILYSWLIIFPWNILSLKNAVMWNSKSSAGVGLPGWNFILKILKWSLLILAHFVLKFILCTINKVKIGLKHVGLLSKLPQHLSKYLVLSKLPQHLSKYIF